MALLGRTPGMLNAFLRDLPEAWTQRNEGPNTWTVSTVVEHLIHCEKANWVPRAKMILEHGEGKTFTPLDREADEAHGRQLGELLDEFARLRAENLEKVRALKLRPEDLQRKGKHPNFGTVTLSELLATWATHDLTHLHQISRVMAHQYRETVGPWKVFLGVLKCEGHSEKG